MATRAAKLSDEVEAELKRLIAYMNDTVVPEVRRSTSLGLRRAADELGRMAGHLERGKRATAAASAGQASGQSAGRPAEATADRGTGH